MMLLDFRSLTETTNDQPPAINSVTEAINDLYVYLVAVNVAVEKGVDLPPDDPFVKYKAEVNRLPYALPPNVDSFSEIILKNTDKIVDEKLMSTLENSWQPYQTAAKKYTNRVTLWQRFWNNVALESFTNIFGPNGMYSKFTNLSGEAAVLARSEKLETLTAKNSAFKDRFSRLNDIVAIRQGYFDKGSNTHFWLTVKVLILTPAWKANVSYAGKAMYTVTVQSILQPLLGLQRRKRLGKIDISPSNQ